MKHKKEPTGTLYTIGRGKNRFHVWVPQSRLMYLSHSSIPPIIWMTAGKPIMVVEGEGYMRAADVIAEMPERSEIIRALAQRLGAIV